MRKKLADSLRCPLCEGELAVLVGPADLSFHCDRSSGQFVNHGELLTDPLLPYHKAIKEALGKLLRTWEDKAAFLAKVGATALASGRPEVGDTFGREAEAAATKSLILRRHLSDPASAWPSPRPDDGFGRAGGLRMPRTEGPSGVLHVKTSEAKPGRGVITLEGGVDYSNVTYLRAALEAFLRKGITRIVLEMAGVTHLASCALSTLLSALDRAEAKGGGIVLAAVPSPVERILRIIGLGQVFRRAKDAPAALAALE